MLQQFTWQHFLVATLVLTILWYVAVALIFYRAELMGLFGVSGMPATAERLPHRWGKGVDELPESVLQEPELMGRSKMPEGMSSVSSDAFGFGGLDEGERRLEQVGLVPDVLQELKSVFARIAENDGNKRDFLEMMETVRAKFPKIASSPNIGRINGFIADHAPFYLKAEELENLWD